MLCNYYNNPALIAEGREARRKAMLTARDEDEYLAAAESPWEDYVPLCNCPQCLNGEDY